MAKVAGQDAGGYGGMLTFSTKAPASGTAGNPVERMRIDSNGNIGIGTSLTTFPLTIYKDNPTDMAEFHNTQSGGAATLRLVTADGSATIFGQSATSWGGLNLKNSSGWRV